MSLNKKRRLGVTTEKFNAESRRRAELAATMQNKLPKRFEDLVKKEQTMLQPNDVVVIVSNRDLENVVGGEESELFKWKDRMQSEGYSYEGKEGVRELSVQTEEVLSLELQQYLKYIPMGLGPQTPEDAKKYVKNVLDQIKREGGGREKLEEFISKLPKNYKKLAALFVERFNFRADISNAFLVKLRL